MAFSYDSKDVGAALGQAIADKRTREEVPVTFGYSAGSPGRFAGDQLRENIGMLGEFGGSTKDPGMKPYYRDWTSYWASGPFGPDGVAGAGVA